MRDCRLKIDMNHPKFLRALFVQLYFCSSVTIEALIILQWAWIQRHLIILQWAWIQRHLIILQWAWIQRHLIILQWAWIQRHLIILQWAWIQRHLIILQWAWIQRHLGGLLMYINNFFLYHAIVCHFGE